MLHTIKLTIVGNFVPLLEYELLCDLPLLDDNDDDDDAPYVSKLPIAAALVDLLADDFDDEPTPTPMATAATAINASAAAAHFFVEEGATTPS